MICLPLEPDPTQEPIYQRLEGEFLPEKIEAQPPTTHRYQELIEKLERSAGLVPLRVKFITKKVDFDNVRLAEEKAESEGMVCWAEGVFTNLTKAA